MRHQHHKQRRKDKKLYQIAGTMVSFLRRNGVHIMRYDAVTTNSIYLKLDYGVLYSLRISDHPGKRHLGYRYNVTKGYDGPRYGDSKYTWQREYYSTKSDDLNDLCLRILAMREAKILKDGPYLYEKEMEYRQEMNRSAKGFWQAAKDLG